MNLSAYDNVEHKIDRTKTWTLIKRREILSREIARRKYYTISKRYNPQTCSTNYYIIVLDERSPTHTCNYLRVDDFGRVKLKVGSIWNDTILCKLNKDINIHIEHIEHADDGDIYFVDI